MTRFPASRENAKRHVGELGTWLHPSKDRDLVPRRLREVVVDGEEDHEAEEEAPRREEVPDVVVVVEVEQPAIIVKYRDG